MKASVASGSELLRAEVGPKDRSTHKGKAAGSPTAGFDEVLSRVAGGRQNTALQAAVPRSSPTPPATKSHRVAAPVVKLLPEQQVDEELGLAKPERQKSREEAPRAPAASPEVTALESVPAALQAALGQALQGAALQVPQHALVEAPQNTGYQGFARSEPARPVRDARLEALMQPAFPPPSRSLARQLDAKESSPVDTRPRHLPPARDAADAHAVGRGGEAPNKAEGSRKARDASARPIAAEYTTFAATVAAVERLAGEQRAAPAMQGSVSAHTGSDLAGEANGTLGGAERAQAPSEIA